MYGQEVERALDEDTTLLGEVWRRREQDAVTIAEERGARPGFVYSYRRYTRAIVDGILPESPTLARQCASAIRGFLNRHPGLSAETRSILQGRADQCNHRANDFASGKAEEQVLEGRSREAENTDVPGIYVYTLPHYLRHPIEVSENDKTDDRTYLKVGMSLRDARKRALQQQTGLPEPLILLRIYAVQEKRGIRQIEGKIHCHLSAADHPRNARRGAGKEWFLTHLKFLDSTAKLLGLEIHFANEDYL